MWSPRVRGVVCGPRSLEVNPNQGPLPNDNVPHLTEVADSVFIRSWYYKKRNSNEPVLLRKDRTSHSAGIFVRKPHALRLPSYITAWVYVQCMNTPDITPARDERLHNAEAGFLKAQYPCRDASKKTQYKPQGYRIRAPLWVPHWVDARPIPMDRPRCAGSTRTLLHPSALDSLTCVRPPTANLKKKRKRKNALQV